MRPCAGQPKKPKASALLIVTARDDLSRLRYVYFCLLRCKAKDITDAAKTINHANGAVTNLQHQASIDTDGSTVDEGSLLRG